MQMKLVAVTMVSFFILQGLSYAKSQTMTQSTRQLITFYKAQSLSPKISDLSNYKKCVDNSSSTLELMNCSGDEIDKQDKTLNILYKSLTQNMNEEKRNRLQSAQRKWIKERDKVCDLVSDDEGGGSLSAVIYNDCILVLTTKRKAELRNLINSK